MIPYTMLHILPLFKQEVRHFSLFNSNNILTNPADENRFLSQLNGHLESINTPQPQQALLDKKITQFNDAFIQSYELDKNYKNDFLKERFRPNIMGLSELRRLVDVGFKYHLAIATNAEREILQHYTDLEDEYYNKLYIATNIDEPE